jgi:hypothetical protein
MHVAGGLRWILGVAYPAAGPSRILCREVGRSPPRILARFSSEPPKSGSAERRGARVTSRPRSEYADVTDMLRHLMTLHEQSSQCRRQREVIIERCLPLADHIARWFSNRGEPLEDFVQVARMGLIQAVNRLTPTTVPISWRSPFPP